jgi:hypothetical protein
VRSVGDVLDQVVPGGVADDHRHGVLAHQLEQPVRSELVQTRARGQCAREEQASVEMADDLTFDFDDLVGRRHRQVNDGSTGNECR